MTKKTVCSFLMACLAFTACQEKKQAQEALVYKTVKVELTKQEVKAKYSATMKGREMVEIRPQVSGLITKILDSTEWKVFFDVRNYDRLRRIDFDNPLLLSEGITMKPLRQKVAVFARTCR